MLKNGSTLSQHNHGLHHRLGARAGLTLVDRVKVIANPDQYPNLSVARVRQGIWGLSRGGATGRTSAPRLG